MGVHVHVHVYVDSHVITCTYTVHVGICTVPQEKSQKVTNVVKLCLSLEVLHLYGPWHHFEFDFSNQSLTYFDEKQEV